MTYLQLCQRLRAECQDIGSGPSSVQSNATRDAIYINAIKDAWIEIQLLRKDWTFWPDDNSHSLTSPQLLVADNDEPFIPAQYHFGLVYYAMAQRALTLAATEMIEKSNVGWGRYYSMLLDRYTGDVVIGEPPSAYCDDSCYSVGEILAQ